MLYLTTKRIKIKKTIKMRMLQKVMKMITIKRRTIITTMPITMMIILRAKIKKMRRKTRMKMKTKMSSY